MLRPGKGGGLLLVPREFVQTGEKGSRAILETLEGRREGQRRNMPRLQLDRKKAHLWLPGLWANLCLTHQCSST